jgi:hypothetical protein
VPPVESPLGRSAGDIVPSCDFESWAKEIAMPPGEAIALRYHVCKYFQTLLYTMSTKSDWPAAKGGDCRAVNGIRIRRSIPSVGRHY